MMNKVAKERPLFLKETVTQSISRIVTPFGVCLYLVEGEEKALLLDTGMGFGDLKAFVDSICDKPYEVLLSHGHCDHAGGAGQFETVYLHHADCELAKSHCNNARRTQSLEQTLSSWGEPIEKPPVIPARERPYLNLEEGMIFPLGGCSVEIVEVPGHTRGMLTLLIPEERIMIFGDACGVETLLIFPESTSVEEYEQSLLHLQEYEQRYDMILRNHGSYQSPRSLLQHNLMLCRKILEHSDKAYLTAFHGQNCLAGEKPGGTAGNILYCSEKIYRNQV